MALNEQAQTDEFALADQIPQTEDMDIEPLVSGPIIAYDLSGNGNHLYRQDDSNKDPNLLQWTRANASNPKSRDAIQFFGTKQVAMGGGSYLKTAADAPINTEKFENGYTIEAIVKLPANFDAVNNAWMGILTREGGMKEIGQGNSFDPIATMSVSNLREVQWAVAPLEGNAETNWSWDLDNSWHRIAVVNDGQETKMYIDDVLVMRNTETPQRGLASVDKAWLIGNSLTNFLDVANMPINVFNGWISEIRMVDRPLEVSEFLQ
jgi:hypothetical protein